MDASLQGKHTKIECLLDSEDFVDECQKWLQQQKPEGYLPKELKNHIEETVFPKITGHIKKDYNGDELNEIIEPQLQPGEKEHVLVTHDECHFYANEGQKKIWVQDEEDIFDEQLKSNPNIKFRKAHVLHSIEADGYWKSEHMIEQLVNRTIPIFEVLHPGCVGVFCFDQSTNHNAMAEDALIVTRMNLGPAKKQAKLHDGWYTNKEGEKCIQKMVFGDEADIELRGEPKGIQLVLTECGLWPAEKIRLVCDQCSGKMEKDPNRQNCCARRILSCQLDFLEQKSALEESIIAAKHIFEKYPNHGDIWDAYEKGLEGRIAEWVVKKYKSHRWIPDNINEFFETELKIFLKFILVQNRQGKTRLSKWYVPYEDEEKNKIKGEVHRLVAPRDQKHQSNFVEFQNYKIIYRRYAGLFFCVCVDANDNELSYLEAIHFFVEVLDTFFGNVCELDLVFNFYKVYAILDEVFLTGEIEETSKNIVLTRLDHLDKLE
ncbi:18952_t:CDS:2 [Entrophospora sp. SA101]|nr:18952_t:CDS:2 [Entrophospora sp. SA101]